MEIRTYSQNDEAGLVGLLQREGWTDYYSGDGMKRYRKALSGSVTYIAADGGLLCGYVRCREDDGFGIYVYDLLVDKEYRGRGLGKQLLDRVRADFPDESVYVMSDVDDYYKKLGYDRAGTVFTVD